MSDHHERSERDVLEQAIRALRDAPMPDGPPTDVVAATVRKLLTRSTAQGAFRPRNRTHLMRMGRYGVAASVLLAVAASVLWLIDRSASSTFAQVVDEVKKATSVRFVVRQKLGDQPELETRVHIQGGFIRHETADLIIIVLDTNQRRGIQLDMQRKVATKIDLDGRVPREELTEPIERLRNLKEDSKDSFRQLADEDINERKCHVYEVKGGKGAAVLIPDEFKLWVDAKTSLPVKIHAGNEQFSLVYDRFQWNEPIKEELLSLGVPRGYRLEELAPAVVRPGRIYYHKGWAQLYSIDPDGAKPETQFVPRPENSPSTYASHRTELSPDGRHLAIGYAHVTKKGLCPPNRVLLWDRTNPKEPAVEAYLREDGELESWQYSTDGTRLYVNWWEAIPPREGPKSHTGTDVVDLKTKTKEAVKLPTYRDAGGNQAQMRFAAATHDGKQYLVVGNGLHLATAEGKIVRRLSAGDSRVVDGSVRLSPDGKRAVYTTFHEDLSHALFVVSLIDGQDKKLVGAGKMTKLRAAWSPDGRRIAYSCRLLDPANPPFNYGREVHLKLIDADGSNAIALLTEAVHPKGSSLELTGWR